MLAEGDNTALIIGLIILAPLIIWIIGWIYALTRGTARFVRHQTTKDPEVRARIEHDIYRGMQERGYDGPQPERRYQTWGERQGEGDPALGWPRRSGLRLRLGRLVGCMEEIHAARTEMETRGP